MTKSKLIPRKYLMGGAAPDGIYVEFPSYQIKTGSSKLPLGHGMVIAVNEDTGQTRGSEYGRYQSNKGQAHRVAVPDFKMKNPGKPTKEELNTYAKNLYNSYAKGHSSGNKVRIHYIKGADENKMIKLMKSAETNNREKGFYTNSDYRIIDHNCGTYAADMIKQSMPWYNSGGFSLYTFGTPSGVAPKGVKIGEYKKENKNEKDTIFNIDWLSSSH